MSPHSMRNNSPNMRSWKPLRCELRRTKLRSRLEIRHYVSLPCYNKGSSVQPWFRLSLGFFMAASPGKLVGIDLGTTFCAIATLDDHGQAVTLPNIEGEMLTPSAVLIEDGSAVVGQAARDVSLEQPDRVAVMVKRFMGHPAFGYKVADRLFRPETL